MDNLKLYRRRFIPNEKKLLDKDKVLYFENNQIITKWNTIKPRLDFNHGYSYYLIDENIKISKMFNEQKEFLFYYCDIIETEKISSTEYVFNDLLVDIIVMPSGFVKVLDLDEVPECLENNLITLKQFRKLMTTANNLLEIIYNNKFNELVQLLNLYIEEEKIGV